LTMSFQGAGMTTRPKPTQTKKGAPEPRIAALSLV
jgi:hypothetical protein